MSALANLSFVALRQNNLDRALELAESALDVARELANPRATSAALMALGDVSSAQGDHEAALARYEEAVELRSTLGDPLLVADATYNLGMAALQGGDNVRAREAFEDALALARELHERPHVAAAQFMLALLDVLAGNARAADRIRESLDFYTEVDDDRSRARCLLVLAGAAVAARSFENAARLVGAAEALRDAQAPDMFEVPVLERYLPELERALGERTLSELKAEGARYREPAGTRVVVSSGIE